MILRYNDFVSEKFDYTKQKDEVIDKTKPFDVNYIKMELERKLQIKPKTINVCYDRNGWLDIDIDFVDSKDWPWNLKSNSCYFNFYCIINKTNDGNANVEQLQLRRCPHCNVSPYDREHKYRFFAMRNSMDIGKEIGTTYRRFVPKNDEQLVKKLIDFINPVMKAIDVYTGGYPYHDGIINEPLIDAYRKA